MRITRISVGRLMAVVGIVALNLAAARGLAACDEMLAVGVMPIALVLQVALFRLIRTPEGRRRAFWIGFITAGFLMMLSFVWANRFSGSVGIAKDPVTGKSRRVVIPGSLGGDRIYAIWAGYVDAVVRRLPYVPQSRLVAPVILLMPQMLAASAGGLLAWLVKSGAELHRIDENRKHAIPTEK
jgi:hypothetical protein